MFITDSEKRLYYSFLFFHWVSQLCQKPSEHDPNISEFIHNILIFISKSFNFTYNK